VLKKNNKDKARADSQLRRVHVDAPVVPSKPKNNNLFALLEEDSDDEQLNTIADQPADTIADHFETHADHFETHADHFETHTARTWAQIAATNPTYAPTTYAPTTYSANDLIADDEW
jgi:hypothetical protein